ncbi:2'-5' RNA ligase family protein [Streptomyces sp. NPDC002346]
MVSPVPLVFLLCLGTSLATKEELAANGGYALFPSNPTFESYNVVLSGGVVTRAAVVSVVITLVGTALSLLCTVALAYGLSRPGTVAGKPLLMIVLGTFLFTPGIIPNYLVIQELGMIDTYGALIAPIMLNAFNIVVVRAFFQGIPDELHEAARLDGAGDLRILLRIVLPLSKAVIVFPYLDESRIDASVHSALTDVLGSHPAFDLRFERCGRLPEVLYLVPEPDTQLRQLTEAIADRWPEAPSYGGRFAEIVPHLTIAKGQGDAVLEEIETDLAGRPPFTSHVSSVELMVHDGTKWQERASFALGG